MLAKMSREELIELVRKIARFEGAEDEIHKWVVMLKRNVNDPRVTDYIFHAKPEMTPEEVVDRALSYRPLLVRDQKKKKHELGGSLP